MKNFFVALKKTSEPNDKGRPADGVNSEIELCTLCPKEKDSSGSALLCRTCYETYNMRPCLFNEHIDKEFFYGTLKGDPTITYYNPPNVNQQVELTVYNYKRSLYLHHQVLFKFAMQLDGF